MKFPFSFEANSKRASISARLHSLLPEKDTFFTHIDPEVKKHDLLYNISHTIAHIIDNLTLPDRTEGTFLKLLNQYNLENKSTLKYEDILATSWIRIINEEIIIAEVVGHYIWTWNYNESQGKEVTVPDDDKLHFIRFYQKTFAKNNLPFITNESLDRVMQTHAVKIVDIAFLIEHDILRRNDVGNYDFHADEYTRYLRNEIAGKLWLIISVNEVNLKGLRRFIQLCSRAHMYPDNLRRETTIQDMSKIRDLSIQILKSESDLINSGNEFEKIWFDQHRHNGANILKDAPKLKFEAKDSYSLLQEHESHARWYYEALGYQTCRSPYSLLIRFSLFPHMSGENNPYHHVLDMLCDADRPYLITETYRQIYENHPEVIPYLLDDSELAPIAYKAIDKCKINEKLLRRTNTLEERFEDEKEQLNLIWIELFEITLEQVAQNYDEKAVGVLLYRLLEYVSNRMFDTSSSNVHSVIYHYIFKSRLQTVLQLIDTKRINGTNNLSIGAYNSRLAPVIAKELFMNIKAAKPEYYINDHLNFESGLTHLLIEVLKLLKTKYNEGDILPGKQKELEGLRQDIISFIIQIIHEYFTTNQISVWDFIDNEYKQKSARRIAGFGIELMDWSYLYLVLDRTGYLVSLNNTLNDSVKFNLQDVGKMHSHSNQEQIEKIKFQLYTMLLAFIGISEKRDMYSFMGFNTENTLAKLEKIIIDISLKYSTDNDVNFDVLNDNNFFLIPTLYSKSPSRLLYKSLNYFTPESTDRLVNELFQNSNNIGKLVAAINIIEKGSVKKKINEFINNTDMDKYLSTIGVDIVENTLIDVVNSDHHWKGLSEPLIKEMQTNLQSRRNYDVNTKRLLFEINLVLAFKKKSYDDLINTDIPEYHSHIDYAQDSNTKLFFEAIHLIYNENKYDAGLEKLESLQTNDSRNMKYAYHIFRGKTLKAINYNEGE